MLQEQYRRQQERLDRRAAMATWMLRLIHHDSKAPEDPPSLDEVAQWLGHGFVRHPTPRQAQQTTVEDLYNKMDQLSQFYSNGNIRSDP